MRLAARPLALAAAFLLAAAPLAAQRDTVRVRVVPVADGLHMLVGGGGNIAVSSGEDGAFLVDDRGAGLQRSRFA